MSVDALPAVSQGSPCRGSGKEGVRQLEQRADEVVGYRGLDRLVHHILDLSHARGELFALGGQLKADGPAIPGVRGALDRMQSNQAIHQATRPSAGLADEQFTESRKGERGIVIQDSQDLCLRRR